MAANWIIDITVTKQASLSPSLQQDIVAFYIRKFVALGEYFAPWNIAVASSAPLFA